MSILDRKVLAQDQPQQDERSGPDRKKREREEEAYNREVEEVRQQNILIDKQNADAEAKYQKELADFNALQNQKTELQEIELRYAAQVKQVQENKDKVLSDSYNAFWGAGGGHDSGQSRQQFSIEQSNLASSHDILINKILREEQSVKLPILLREEGYAPSVVDKITRNFVKGKYTTIDSAFKRADQFVVGKKAKQEYDAQTQIQLARIAPSYTKEQSNAIETGTTYLRGRATPEMKARAAEIKPTTLPKGTTFNLVPAVANNADQVRGLTRVNTGQSIMSSQKASPTQTIITTNTYRKDPTAPASFDNPNIPITITREIQSRPASKGVPQGANPRAYVAGLQKNIPVAGTVIEKKPIELINTTELTQTGKIRVTNLNEWNGQQTQKVRISDPKIDAMIGAYGYDKTNEIITNRNRIITSNNLILTKQYLKYGKSIGAEKVKVKTKTGTKIFSIDDVTSISSTEGEMSFVRSEKMRSDKLNQIQQTRDFLNVSEKSGFEKFEIRTPGKKTEVVFLEDKRLAAERIRAAEQGSSFKLVKTDAMKQEQTDYFEQRRGLINSAKSYESIKITSSQGEKLISVENKKEAQKQIRNAPVGSTFETVTTNEDAFSKRLRENEKDDPTGLKTEIGLTMSSFYNIVKGGSEKLISSVVKGPEYTIGKTVIKKPGLEQNLGIKILPDKFNLGADTYVPQSAASGFIASPFRASSESENFGELVSKTQKYSGESVSRFQANPVRGFGGALFQGVMLLSPVRPKVPASVSYGLYKAGQKLNIAKVKNFASKTTKDVSIKLEARKNLAVVKKYAFDTQEGQTLITMEKKNPKSFQIFRGESELRPNIKDVKPKSQFAGYERYFNDPQAPFYPVYSKSPKVYKQSQKPVEAKVPYTEIRFGEKFKVVKGKLVEVNPPGTLIERPSLPELAKKKSVAPELDKKKFPILVRVEDLPKKRRVIGIREASNDLSKYLTKKLDKALLQPKKANKTRKPIIKKITMVEDFMQVPEKRTYRKINEINITSKDPQFDRTAQALGMKRFGPDSFITKPTSKFMKQIRVAEESGFTVKTAISKSAPLKLFQQSKEKTVRPQRPIDVFSKIKKSPDKIIDVTKKGEWSETGLVVYHGTPFGEKIIRGGFKNKSKIDMTKNANVIFTTDNPNYAKDYATGRTQKMNVVGSILKITLKKGTTQIRFDKLSKELGEQGKIKPPKSRKENQKNISVILKEARKRKYDLITGVEEGNIIRIILNKKAIKTIEDVDGKLGIKEDKSNLKYQPNIRFRDRLDVITGPSPLKLIGERITRKPKTKLSQFDYLGENAVVTEFYETRGGFGKPISQLKNDFQPKTIKRNVSFDENNQIKTSNKFPKVLKNKEKSIGVGSTDEKRYIERLGRVEVSKDDLNKILSKKGMNELTEEEFKRTQTSINPPRKWDPSRGTPYNYSDIMGKSKGIGESTGKAASLETVIKKRIETRRELSIKRINDEELLKVKDSGLSKKEYYKKIEDERFKRLQENFPTKTEKLVKPSQTTNYLQSISTYSPKEKSQTELYNQQGRMGDFTVEEETIRYPELKTVKKIEFAVIPKMNTRTFSGQRGQIKTNVLLTSRTDQAQDSLLSTAQVTKQQTRQEAQTKQVQKMMTKTSELFSQKPRLLTGLDTISITETKLNTGLKQTPVQQLKQPQLLKQVQKLEFRIPLPNPRRTTTKPPRIRLLPFALPPEEKKTPVKRTYQPGDKADFLGNVSESQIGGIFNRSEVTYGQRKINKLLAGDRRVVRGGKRATSRQAKWVEGKGKDPFGFKYEAKKKKSFKLSL